MTGNMVGGLCTVPLFIGWAIYGLFHPVNWWLFLGVAAFVLLYTLLGDVSQRLSELQKRIETLERKK
jgi:4-hydroxybenzoate polyprenyltransferase